MIILIILCILLFSLLLISCYYLLRFAKIVLTVEDAINESFDQLEQSIKNIHKILQTPVAFDDPFIKGVMNEIKKSHEVITNVANLLTNSLESNKKDESTEEQ